MATLKEIYDLTLDLLDKRDGGGTLDAGRLMNLAAKFPQLASPIALELAEANNTYLENPLFEDLSEEVDLPAFTSYAVMPYGLAAELARQGGASELADELLLKYRQMKQAIRLPEQTTKDSENALRGLSGRC